MKLKSLILLTFALFITGTVFAQKTDPAKPAVTPADDKPVQAKLPATGEIIANYVKALGGREANEKIKTRSAKGTIELSPMGVKGTVEVLSAAPDKSYTNGNLTGIGTFLEGYDGKVSWTSDPMRGAREKSGQELLQVKLSTDFYRELHLDKLYPKMEVKGIESVGGKDAYVVVATPDGVPAETFYFDVASGLLVRSDSTAIAPEGTAAIKTFYEDYRDVDGIKVPFKTRSVLPQYELVTTLTEVKNNVAIDDAKFSKPKP
jgi:zinc protease